MKNVISALICISTSLVVLNCSNDESMPVQGKVQFALTITSTRSEGGRILSQAFPTDSYISLSIETASGASVYSLTKIDLITLGDGYITAPLVLAEGDFQLTDFFVMSAGNEILYATPKERSPLAGLVEHPLPMNFSITADGISNLNIQVVDAEQQSPEDFGYVSFGVQVVGSEFSISVFTGNGSLSFASAKLLLYQGTELIYTQDLSARVNAVNYSGDLNTTYTLVVEKEGYSIKTREYVLSDLLTELDGQPLAVLLSSASTYTVLVKTENFPVRLNLTTDSEDIYIDWGDGIVERGTVTSGMFIGVEHIYGKTGRFYINITGDLQSITGYEHPFIDYAIYNHQIIEHVDVTALSELKSFFFIYKFPAPGQINFSHNAKLELLDMTMSRAHNLDISNNPKLNNLSLYATTMTYENDNNILKIIDDLERNAIVNNTFGGRFSFDGIPPELEEGQDGSLVKLRRLKNEYHWEVYPDPD